MTDFLLLTSSAALFAVVFALLLRDTMLLSRRPDLADRQTGEIVSSQRTRLGWILFVSVMAAATVYLTFRFATDPHEMPDVNRALFWIVFGFQIVWLVRALYRRYRRAA